MTAYSLLGIEAAILKLISIPSSVLKLSQTAVTCLRRLAFALSFPNSPYLCNMIPQMISIMFKSGDFAGHSMLVISA